MILDITCEFHNWICSVHGMTYTMTYDTLTSVAHILGRPWLNDPSPSTSRSFLYSTRAFMLRGCQFVVYSRTCRRCRSGIGADRLTGRSEAKTWETKLVHLSLIKNCKACNISFTKFTGYTVFTFLLQNLNSFSFFLHDNNYITRSLTKVLLGTCKVKHFFWESSLIKKSYPNVYTSSVSATRHRKKIDIHFPMKPFLWHMNWRLF